MESQNTPPRVKGNKDADPQKGAENSVEQPAAAERTGNSSTPGHDTSQKDREVNEEGKYAGREITNHDEQEKITNASGSDSIPE